jgi:murein DD-endopeptidase MepM/ murein hydrolase activator NlpD
MCTPGAARLLEKTAVEEPSRRALSGLRLQDAAAAAVFFGAAHRKTIVAAAVVLMAGFGITAVAVAPLAPDAAELPQRIVAETLAVPGIAEQTAALAMLDFQLTRSEVTRGTDTAQSLFGRLGIRDEAAVAFVRTDATARRIVTGRGGKMVQAKTDTTGRLAELVVRYPSEQPAQAKTHFTRLTLVPIDGRWLARLDTVPYGAQQRLASGTIRNTLFGATDEAGLPDGVAAQLAEVFATDIDFHRELKKGDTFSVVYEALTADGEPVVWNEGAGRVLSAEFVNGGRSHHAMWFTGPDGRGAWYDKAGLSKRKSFLASPMEFSRVTSGFAMRMHPLLQTWRQHKGVDYAAPKGTPVRSVGDGVVDFAGWRNGYGNVVEVLHREQRSTVYAHLSRIDVRKGQRIDQGQHLGAVGATGWATGPHLHFEFRIDGVHQDPLRIAKAAETVPLDPRARGQFAHTVQRMQAQLDVAETLAGPRVASE